MSLFKWFRVKKGGKLEPCGLGPDGEIKHIDELKYRPSEICDAGKLGVDILNALGMSAKEVTAISLQVSFAGASIHIKRAIRKDDAEKIKPLIEQWELKRRGDAT